MAGKHALGREASPGQAGLPGQVGGGARLAGPWMAGWGRGRWGCGAAQVRPKAPNTFSHLPIPKPHPTSPALPDAGDKSCPRADQEWPCGDGTPRWEEKGSQPSSPLHLSPQAFFLPKLSLPWAFAPGVHSLETLSSASTGCRELLHLPVMPIR